MKYSFLKCYFNNHNSSVKSVLNLFFNEFTFGIIFTPIKLSVFSLTENELSSATRTNIVSDFIAHHMDVFYVLRIGHFSCLRFV